MFVYILQRCNTQCTTEKNRTLLSHTGQTDLTPAIMREKKECKRKENAMVCRLKSVNSNCIIRNNSIYVLM